MKFNSYVGFVQTFKRKKDREIKSLVKFIISANFVVYVF